MVVVVYVNSMVEKLCQCVPDWCRCEYFGLGVEVVNRLKKGDMNEWILYAYRFYNKMCISTSFGSWDMSMILCWVYACTKVNPNELLHLFIDFGLPIHSFYDSYSLPKSALSQYFFLLFFHYLYLYSWHSTSHLLLHAMTLYMFTSTRRGITNASTCHNSYMFASIRCRITNAFPHVVGGVEMWAVYDIGKSWARTRYMCGEPCNTLFLSSVLDHHWWGELWSTSTIVISLITS